MASGLFSGKQGSRVSGLSAGRMSSLEWWSNASPQCGSRQRERIVIIRGSSESLITYD